MQWYTQQSTLTWSCSLSCSWSCTRKVTWTWEFRREREQNKRSTPGIVVCTCNPTTWEVEPGGSDTLKVILGYIMSLRPTWAIQNTIWNGTNKIYPKNTIAKPTWNYKISPNNTRGRQVWKSKWEGDGGEEVRGQLEHSLSCAVVCIRNVAKKKNLPASSTELCIGQLVPSRAVYTSTQG